MVVRAKAELCYRGAKTIRSQGHLNLIEKVIDLMKIRTISYVYVHLNYPDFEIDLTSLDQVIGQSRKAPRNWSTFGLPWVQIS